MCGELLIFETNQQFATHRFYSGGPAYPAASLRDFLSRRLQALLTRGEDYRAAAIQDQASKANAAMTAIQKL